MYFEKVKTTIKGKTYVSKLIPESYRENGKVKHRTICNLSKLPDHLTRQIEDGLKGGRGSFDANKLENGNIREYGGSAAFTALARDIGLTNDICSTHAEWAGNALAMIIGRILYQGSKLSLVNQYMDTALWEFAGHAPNVRPDVEWQG